MALNEPKHHEILLRLADAGVEAIVVGMAAAVILLETRFGDFDCLGAIDGSRSYADLLEASVALDLDGRSLRVIGLGELLQIKKRAGRPKDLARTALLSAA